jgi:hypothetical protein
MFSFKKVSPPKPPRIWNAHVTGEVKFSTKNKYTHADALYADIEFKVVMTKGDESFELDLTASGAIVECEHSWQMEAFYQRAVKVLQNRRGELDMSLKGIVEKRIKYYFESESEKDARAKFEEIIKTPIHIKMDVKIKDEDVFQ